MNEWIINHQSNESNEPNHHHHHQTSTCTLYYRTNQSSYVGRYSRLLVCTNGCLVSPAHARRLPNKIHVCMRAWYGASVVIPKKNNSEKTIDHPSPFCIAFAAIDRSLRISVLFCRSAVLIISLHCSDILYRHIFFNNHQLSHHGVVFCFFPRSTVYFEIWFFEVHLDVLPQGCCCWWYLLLYHTRCFMSCRCRQDSCPARSC